MSLFQDGAVGARVIQVSAHVRLGGEGAVKVLLSVLTWSLPRSVAVSRRGEEALHRTVLSLQSFWHHSQLSSPSSYILPCIVPQVVMNLGPVT